MPKAKTRAARGRPLVEDEEEQKKKRVAVDVQDITRCMRRAEEGKTALPREAEMEVVGHLRKALKVYLTAELA